ncbi:response regulator [Desulfonema magnum]|uniref:Two component system response regulator n=1 Tax=Desulfonema magnum TaxID=45655 RepID=A0A975GN92_9BACT|nr:response regulator [Desulfonema magnum]QTA86638.1 Two component system response regulator [Desulfonema magnum]
MEETVMGEKASILIVDDNTSLSMTMSFVLKHKGYSVATAADGPEALEKIREEFFDIIFIDIKMTPINGVETYKKIRDIRSESVAIMMTAYTVDELVQEALQEGAYGVLYKPLDMDEILTLLEDIQKKKAMD